MVAREMTESSISERRFLEKENEENEVNELVNQLRKLAIKRDELDEEIQMEERQLDRANDELHDMFKKKKEQEEEKKL